MTKTQDASVDTPWALSRPSGSACRRKPVLVAAVILGILASGLAIACLAQLDHVYSWDQLKYHGKAIHLLHQFRDSPASAVISVAQSVRRENHNDLAAVPLAAWASVFGEGRQTYVLGIIVLYAIPTSVLFVIMMCAAYGRYCEREAASWLTVGWLLIPWLIGAFWTPTILGRVAVGGLGLIFAAVWLQLRHPVELQAWWEPICVGGLLASAVLFRRWYLFAVIGVLAAIAVQIALALRRTPQVEKRVRLVGAFLLLVLTCVGIVMGLAGPVFHGMLNSDTAAYLNLYHHAGSVLYLWGNPWSLTQRLGWPSLLVVLAAFVVGWRQLQLRGFLAATTLAAAVALALFARVQAPGAHHILMWVGAECVVLGIGLVQVSSFPPRASRIAVGVSVLMLSTSVASVLFLRRSDVVGFGLRWQESLAPSMTVGDFLPRNLDLVHATLNFVETSIPTGSSIVLLASGLSLNDDTLRRIDFSLPEQDVATRYQIMRTRHIGGRIPPNYIFQADYVVVVDPVAQPLLQRYEVLRTAAEMLLKDSSSLAACFDVVAGPFALPDGRTITALKLRSGTKKRARRILADELDNRLCEHRRSVDPAHNATPP